MPLFFRKFNLSDCSSWLLFPSCLCRGKWKCRRSHEAGPGSLFLPLSCQRRHSTKLHFLGQARRGRRKGRRSLPHGGNEIKAIDFTCYYASKHLKTKTGPTAIFLKKRHGQLSCITALLVCSKVFRFSNQKNICLFKLNAG